LFSATQAVQRFAFNVYGRLALKANSFIRFPKVLNGGSVKLQSNGLLYFKQNMDAFLL